MYHLAEMHPQVTSSVDFAANTSGVLQPSSKISNEICRICEMVATGNNFGIPTCESCKTFFRRNAKREPKKCLHDGNCKVEREFRKSCTSCRLNKCFKMGMRKDHILPDEKLKTRAKPHFKKPRFKWCRVPANLDIDSLVQQGIVTHTKMSPYSELDDIHSQQSIQIPSFSECHTTQIKQEVLDILNDCSGQFSESVGTQCNLEVAVDNDAFHVYNAVSKDIHNVISTYTSPYERDFHSTLTSELCNLEGGFSLLEASVRKMIRVIPMMPFIRHLDKDILGKLVKERVFGAIQIISTLTYDYDGDVWSVTMEETNGIFRQVQTKVRDAIIATFGSLTMPRQSYRPFITMEDVEHIYVVLKDYYSQMRASFGEHRDFAVIILLGIYLFQDDPFISVTPEQRNIIRLYKSKYHSLFKCFMRDIQRDRMDVEGEVFLLMQNVRWMEVRYNDGAKQVELTKVPPLMQELAITQNNRG